MFTSVMFVCFERDAKVATIAIGSGGRVGARGSGERYMWRSIQLVMRVNMFPSIIVHV